MKKVITTTLALTFSLAACGLGGNSPGGAPTPTPTPTQSTPDSTPTPTPDGGKPQSKAADFGPSWSC